LKKSVRFTRGLALAALLAFGLAGHASAQQRLSIPVLITVDEHGNGNVQGPLSPTPFPLPGVLAPDPGPGGSASALTYYFPSLLDVVPGDVILREPDSRDAISDIIRFNPLSEGATSFISFPDDILPFQLPVTPASLVFYSDSGDGVDSLADQSGFPTEKSDNVVYGDEVGSEGDNGFWYTPGPDDPGYLLVPDGPFSVEAQYHFISDGTLTPEPGSLALLATGGLPLLGLLRRRRMAAV
jgi:hypothetical protein